VSIVELIRAKRDGEELTDAALRRIIREYTDGQIPDYQMAALLMAIFIRGFNARELATWTHAMLESGDRMDWSHLPALAVDKHSTGGVGDKISIPLAPAVAACGAAVPMVSGRGLGHTGGTLDKLESIPGFRTRIPLAEARTLMERLSLVMMGQTDEVAPADRKLYALRDVTGTVDSIPLISSSIMSKKLAEGISGLVLDVKCGSGAFMKSLDRARQLATTLAGIGGRCGCTTVALITRMDRPLGICVGNALEMRESIEVLRGGGPEDIRELTIALGAEMLVLARVAPDLATGRQRLAKSLDDGSALARFAAMVEGQGGDPRVAHDLSLLPAASDVVVWESPTQGFIESIDTERIGQACRALGAGRERAEDPIDPAVGFEVLCNTGAFVRPRDPIVRLHVGPLSRVDEAMELLRRAFRFAEAPPAPEPLIYGRIVEEAQAI
jgi:pyrimidine-nucleoside phosphorylase